MDIQKIATYGTAAAVVGTGSVVGGNYQIDKMRGGPEKRAEAEATELRMIVREEVRRAFWDAWPENTGPVKGSKKDPSKDYREETPSRQ
tara:strand:- start:192 stop:458 length:267 start_codon:yes stop_codon:yes gene_type:complete